jgi:hypothetical protein
MHTMRGKLLAGLLITIFCLPVASARADEDRINWLGGFETVFWGSIIEGACFGYGAVTTIGNLTYLPKGYRPPNGWLVHGYISSALNLAVGIVILAVDPKEDIWMELAVSNLALGGVNLGITLWASQQPEWSEPTLSLGPVVMSDIEGNPAAGVGLRLAAW